MFRSLLATPFMGYTPSVKNQVMGGLANLSIPVDQILPDDKCVAQETFAKLGTLISEEIQRAEMEYLVRVLQFSKRSQILAAKIVPRLLHRSVTDRSYLRLIPMIVATYPVRYPIYFGMSHPISLALKSVARTRSLDQFTLLLNPEIVGPDLPLQYVMVHAIYGVAQVDAGRQFMLWLEQYLQKLVATALVSSIDAPCQLEMEQFVEAVFHHGNPFPVKWFFRATSRYWADLFQGDPKYSDDLARLPLHRRGYLMGLLLNTDLEYSLLLSWVVKTVIPGYPDQWRKIAIETITASNKSAETDQIIQLVTKGTIAIDAIDLFRCSCKEGKFSLPLAKIDPTTCHFVRGETDKFLSFLATNQQPFQELREILDYCTTMICPCRQICDPAAITDQRPFHSGPLPLQQEGHRLLVELIQNQQDRLRRPRNTFAIEALADYSRRYDLPVHYYLVGEIVIMIQSPCAQNTRHPASLYHRYDQGVWLAFDWNDTDAVAISMANKTIQVEDAIAACKQILTKKAC